MAITQPTTATTISAPDIGQNYRAPLAMVTTLFFMWGSLTSLNDILIPSRLRPSSTETMRRSC